jgi:hypothetical protein
MSWRTYRGTVSLPIPVYGTELLCLDKVVWADEGNLLKHRPSYS